MLHARGCSDPILSRMLGFMHALLLAKANTALFDNDGGTAVQWAEVPGKTTTAMLIQQYAALSPATDSPAASHGPFVNSLTPLPLEIYESAE